MLGGARGYGSNITFSHYNQAKNILLLSDSSRFPLGKQLSNKFPLKNIISTDYAFKRTVQTRNYVKMHMDNRQGFPFSDNSFDVIAMRRGLCVCRAGYSCGGFCATNEESSQFFEKVIKALDKGNPDSIAILHGEYGTSPSIQRLWKEQLEELESRYPISSLFIYSSPDNREVLNSIILFPKR